MKNAQTVIMISTRVKNVIHVIAQKVKYYVYNKAPKFGAFVIISI